MNSPRSNLQRVKHLSPKQSMFATQGDKDIQNGFRKSKIKEQLSAVKLKTLMVSNALKKSSSQSKCILDTPPKILRTEKKLKQYQEDLNDSQYCEEESPYLKRIQKSYKFVKDERGHTKEIQRESRDRVYNIPYFIQEQSHKELCNSLKNNPEDSRQIISLPKHCTDSVSTSSSLGKNKKIKVSDFELGGSLGAGKFGQVFLARHKQTGFVCALKQISIVAVDDILLTQLIRQIKIQMFLNHPNIVKLYTFFKDQESQSIFLVLELCISGQLYAFLKKNQNISEDLGKVIIKHVCQGIDYLHENSIIHRDLKPENILYQNGLMKICDFGWSVDTHLMRETFCGTPLYVSPELLKKNYYDNKVDIWSMGVLSYQILLGRVPFEIYTETDCIKIITKQVMFPRQPEISEDAKDFIRKCMEKAPEARPTTSQLLEHPFLEKVQLISFPQIF